MTRADRRTFLRRYGAGLVGVVGVYLLVTVLRSIRADFAPEIRRGLGQEVDPTLFTRSETLVALGVLGVNGLSVLIRDNHRAFYTAIAVAAGGVGLVAVSFGLLGAGHLGGFWFMVLVGLGLYLPYVAVHTTLFERLLAMTPEPGNVGFLMYVADAVGYLGFVVVMLGRGAFVTGGSYLRFFSTLGWGAAGLSIILLAHSAWWFMSRTEARA